MSAKLIQELEQWKAALGGHIKTLEDARTLIVDHGLHAVPEFKPGADGHVQVQIRLVNFQKSGAEGGQTLVEGPPASIFYEAYREILPKIFELALGNAQNSVAERAKEIRATIENRRIELDQTEEALAQYLSPKKARGSK